MTRGEIWSIAGEGEERAAIVLQDDRFGAMLTVTVCPLTPSKITSVYARLEIAPSKTNGLSKTTRAMVDKVTTVAKAKLDKRIGALEKAELARIEEGVKVFLGMGG